MQSIPSLFDFNGQTIRTVTRDDQVWFVAQDVAEALGYSNPSRDIRNHCRKVQLIAGTDLVVASNHAALSHNDRVRRHQIINEADLYRLVLRSNLPAAEKFADWICDEVLPTLRRDGTYTMPGSIPPAWVATPSVDLLALKSCFTKKPATNLTASESQMVRSLASAFTKAGLPEPLDGHKVTPLLARVVADRLLLSKRTGEIERRVETLITADMD